MAIAFRAVANTSYTSRSNTSVSKPTGTVDGDIMVMSLVLASATSQAATLTLTPPAGWTKFGTAVAQTQSGGAFHGGFHVYWRRAASEGSSYAFTHATMSSQAVITSYSGCLASGDPVDTFSQFADLSTIAVATGVTTTVANTMLVLHDHGWDGTPSTPPSGMTERFDGLTTAHDEARAATGATGSRSHTVSGASSPTQSYLIALKPATVAAYSITAVAGSYALTGSTVTTKHAWKPLAVAGSYALTGSPVTLTKAGLAAYTLVAAAGSYSLTGSPASFRSTLKVLATAGSYGLTGSDVQLLRGGISTLPVFRAISNTVYSATPNITVTKPTGTINGDVMLAVMFQGNLGGTPPAPSPPTDWTQVGSYTILSDGSFDGRCSVWWKRATGSEPASYTWTYAPATTNVTQGVIASYSGVINSGNPIDVSSTNSANFGGPLTATATGVTTTQNNVKLIYTGNNWDGSATLDPPTGMTERFDGLVYLADESRPTAGATGDRTQSLASVGAWSAYLVGLKGGLAVTAYNVTATAGSYTLTGSPVATTKSGEVLTTPTFRASASVGYAPSSGFTTVNKPTGTVNGDIMVMSFFAGSSTLASIVIDTPPAGWTVIGTPAVVQQGSGSFNGKLWLYWRRASGEGASYTFLHTNTLSTQAQISSYSNCVSSGSPVDAVSQAAQDEAVSDLAIAPSVTTTQGNTKLLYSGHNWNNSGTLSPPTGMTERFDGLLYSADEDRPTAGATGTRSQTQAALNPWQAYLIALKGGGSGSGGVTTYTVNALPGTYTITGTTVTTARGLMASGGSYTLTGRPVTLTGSVGVPPQPVGGNMGVWTGSAWVDKPIRVWNGLAWVVKPVKVWNGSSWV